MVIRFDFASRSNRDSEWLERITSRRDPNIVENQRKKWATRVSFVVMKTAAGELPTTSFAATVEEFGCPDALGQKIG